MKPFRLCRNAGKDAGATIFPHPRRAGMPAVPQDAKSPDAKTPFHHLLNFHISQNMI
jgi:hypothetical protein